MYRWFKPTSQIEPHRNTRLRDVLCNWIDYLRSSASPVTAVVLRSGTAGSSSASIPSQPMNDTDQILKQPKLVFFQYKYAARFPAFLQLHKSAHVRCLAEFFDVAVINDHCDYQHVFDKHEPDITLFEG